ncbi:Ig domain-containing protein, partial [Deinococcus deserti]
MSSKPSDRRPARAAFLSLALLGAVALIGCGQEVTGTSTTSGRDALYFADSAAGLPPIYANEAYTGNLTVLGGAGPYTLRVASGTLPPGLKLSGQTLSGTPTKTGTYKFTVEVTDSTLSTKTKEYTLNVNQLPPLSLQPVLPAGQIRGETRIPVTITAPRSVRAVRLNWTLPAGAAVTGVQPMETGGVLFWRVQGQTVTVDVGFKTIPRNGARVALITVKPARAVALEAKMTYEARDGQGKLLTPAPATEAPATAPAGAPKDSTTPAAPQTTDPARPQTPASA